MLNETDFQNAQRKITLAEHLADNQGLDFDGVAELFHRGFKMIFNEIIEEELTYDEILAFAEKQLQTVYEQFMDDKIPLDAGETYHSENPHAESPLELMPGEPWN